MARATNTLLLLYFAIDVLFVAVGGLILGFTIISQSSMQRDATEETVAQLVLLGRVPLTAGIVNAVLIFITFFVSLPTFFLPANRTWLRAQGWFIVVTTVYTLCLGLAIWLETLQTRRRLATVWEEQRPLVQSLLQQRFNCCGYENERTPPFVQDNVCTNSLVAATAGGCKQAFSAFANSFLDKIFTALFGAVAVDVVLLLYVAMVLKQRAEYARYRIIDQKHGTRGF